MADDEPVILRELNGDFQAFQVVVLEGSNLPDQLQSAIEVRSVRTHYPGNSSASTQVLGTKEDDIVLEGQFRDIWSGATGDGLSRVNRLRAISLAGQLCELSWGSTVVRRGILKRVDTTFKRAGVIGYRLTFEVSEADEALVIAPVPFPPAPEADLAAAMRRIQTRQTLLEVAVGLLNVGTGIF